MLVGELASSSRDIGSRIRGVRAGVTGLAGLLVGFGTTTAQATPPWEPVQKVVSADGAPNDWFGGAVAVSGTVTVVGSSEDDDLGANSGSVYVFERVGGVWTQTGKLHASDGAAGDRFGFSVAFDGTTVIVGAYEDDSPGIDAGSAYLFRKIRGEWEQTAKIVASDGAPGDNFGASVSVLGQTAMVGADCDDDHGVDSGSVYIFDRVGTDWSQTIKMTAADGAANDQFGTSVSLGDGRAIVGAIFDDDLGSNSGAAYMFETIGGLWFQTAKLVASDGVAHDVFGQSVSLSGDKVIVGAFLDDEDAGSAYIFTKVHFLWTQTIKLVAPDRAAGDLFGASVGISGDAAIVGAAGNDGQGLNAGSAYLFERIGNAWTLTQTLHEPSGEPGDFFGYAVGISATTAIVGALFDEDLGSDAGSASFFERVSCPADFNGDNALNFFDVAAFLGAFAASDPAADCTTDGLFDFFDILAFLGAFSAGCP